MKKAHVTIVGMHTVEKPKWPISNPSDEILFSKCGHAMYRLRALEELNNFRKRTIGQKWSRKEFWWSIMWLGNQKWNLPRFLTNYYPGECQCNKKKEPRTSFFVVKAESVHVFALSVVSLGNTYFGQHCRFV